LTSSAEKKSNRLRVSALVGAGGLALLWTMWLAGGDFWPAQRPFMPVTLACAAVMIVAVTLALAIPRGAGRWLLTALAVFAVLATFLGEGLAERGRFDRLRVTLSQEAEVVAQGGACTTPCRIDARAPLRVAFLLSGKGDHWSGACYDVTDQIRGVEFGGHLRPPTPSQVPILEEANAMFGGQVRQAPTWGGHWYGCSTRP
jgi:hypothetical protein